MKLETTPDGSTNDDELSFLLDGGLVARRFGLTATRMRELMDRRMVQGRVEKGVGEDAGRWRLTLRLGNRVWRGIFTADGQLRDEKVEFAGNRKVPETRHG